MTTSKSLEKVIGNLAIPDIDVHDQVMCTLSSPVRQRRLMSYKLLVAVILSTLAIIGTGFASITMINHYNDKGDIWLRILPINEPMGEGISEQYLDLIGEGEGIAVYNPENNTNNVVSSTVKPVTYEDWAQFLQKVKVDSHFLLPNSLSEHYVFKHGLIYYQAAYANVDKLIDQSKNNGGGISYEILAVTDSIQFLTLAVSVQENEYTVKLWGDNHSKQTLYSDELTNSKVTTFSHQNIEGIIAYRHEDEISLIWRPSEEIGSNVLYEIYTNNTDAGVEDEMMMLLAELTK